MPMDWQPLFLRLAVRINSWKSSVQKNWGQRRIAEELTRLIIVFEANEKTAVGKKAESRERRSREPPEALKAALKGLIRKCTLKATQEGDAITATMKWKSKCPASAQDSRPWLSTFSVDLGKVRTQRKWLWGSD